MNQAPPLPARNRFESVQTRCFSFGNMSLPPVKFTKSRSDEDALSQAVNRSGEDRCAILSYFASEGAWHPTQSEPDQRAFQAENRYPLLFKMLYELDWRHRHVICSP